MRNYLLIIIMLLAVISMNGQNTTVTRQPSTKPATTIPKAEKSIQKGSGSQTKTPHKTSRTQQTKQSTSICTDNNHPHAIDLGLPSCTKWACCNVGAVKPEASGGYFAWGETKTKSTFDWEKYTHCDGTGKTCHDLGSSISGTEHDVAHVKWNGSWQMPTSEQFKELTENCNYEWTTVNGVKGGKFTSKKNGQSIFLPAAGRRVFAVFNYVSRDGCYWSGSQHPSHAYGASNLGFYSDGVKWNDYDNRAYGLTVRPVTK